jgi:hypothetical protein
VQAQGEGEARQGEKRSLACEGVKEQEGCKEMVMAVVASLITGHCQPTSLTVASTVQSPSSSLSGEVCTVLEIAAVASAASGGEI